MGIFSIFSKNETRNSEQKNELLVDFKNIDIKELLEGSFLISEREVEGTDITLSVWQAYQQMNVLGIFDTIELTLKGKEKEFDEHDSIGALFFKLQSTTMQQNEYIVNTIAKICDVKNDNWTETDKMRINSGTWRGRMFQYGDTTFYIELHVLYGVTLTIVGFNNFQKTL